MLLLTAIGLLAGMIAGVSPCVLPVLPVVFFAGGPGRVMPAGSGNRVRRPLAIILGLASSFAVFTLLGSTLLTALHLPQGLLRWCGLVVLALVGLALLVPRLDVVLQWPFRRIPARLGRQHAGLPPRSGVVGAFVLGLGLGTLYVPCAGPVLAAISIAGTTGQVSGGVAVLTIAFAVGVALPLLVFGLAGSGISARLSAYRRRSRTFRMTGGAVMVVLAVALAFDVTDGLQRAVPGYTQALQDRVEDNPAARAALAGLAGRSVAPSTAPPTASPAPIAGPAAGRAEGPVTTCVSHATTLANCGPAPRIVGITSWLNTASNHPLTLGELRGKVVLVNFWTFSCINCQRALPFVNSWYDRYRDSGLVVIGVHTPEFAYEHDLGAVRDAVEHDGIHYPVALDNASATWRAFRNSYWPAAYLVDAQGVVRHVVFGEGGYTDSEALIRALLRAADPDVSLPAPTDPAVPIR